jgi:hypothetical protein
MSAIELKKFEMELAKVGAARLELELKIMEREEDILRLKQHISVQLDKEKELADKIKQLKGE